MATMDINDMKDVFLFNDGHETSDKMLDYIKSTLGVEEAGKWNFIGYDVVSVDPSEYERVLKEGKEYAVKNNLGIWWVDHYNDRRSPIASIDLAYGVLPATLLPGEEKKEYSYREFWRDDKFTPPYLLEYFRVMKEFLKVDKIYRTYSCANSAITISPLSLDYENQMKLMEEFVEKYGYGPFETIYPLRFTGELVKEPMKVKKIGEIKKD